MNSSEIREISEISEIRQLLKCFNYFAALSIWHDLVGEMPRSSMYY